MPMPSTFRLALLLTAVGVIAGCATPPQPDGSAGSPPASVPKPAPVPEPPPPAPVPEPAPVAPVVPAGPVSAAQQQLAQKQAMAAVELLDAGNEDQARSDIQAALAADPNNRLAQSLLKQLTADPVATLGKESFAYTVRSTDTLSRIAGRFLNDIFAFYILARYNDIKVPKQVSTGQVLRIPGKAPAAGLDRDPPAPPSRPAATPTPPPPPPAPAPVAVPPPPPPPAAPAEPTPGVKAMRSAEAAERAGDLDRAMADYNRAAGLDQAGAAAKASEVRRKLVQKHSQIARSAFAKQDMDGSIRNWDRVLDLDPSNDAAKLERQRAVALKEKLKGLSK